MSQHSFDAYASLTQSWSKTTITQFGYEVNQINGYQTNPFLRTSVNGVMTVGNSPELRTRQAITARLRQALGSETFVDLDYRRYHDTWAVNSNALSIGLSQHIGARVVAGGSFRLYDQTAAYFYAPSYVGSPTYYTADFRLFPFDSGSYNGRIDITPRRSFFNLPVGTALSFQDDCTAPRRASRPQFFPGGFRIPMKWADHRRAMTAGVATLAVALIARADIDAEQIETRAYRYLMGTSMRVEAIGGTSGGSRCGG